MFHFIKHCHSSIWQTGDFDRGKIAHIYTRHALGCPFNKSRAVYAKNQNFKKFSKKSILSSFFCCFSKKSLRDLHICYIQKRTNFPFSSLLFLILASNAMLILSWCLLHVLKCKFSSKNEARDPDPKFKPAPFFFEIFHLSKST